MVSVLFYIILHHWPIIILPQETHAPNWGVCWMPACNDCHGTSISVWPMMPMGHRHWEFVRMAVSMSKLNTLQNRSSPPCPQAWMMPIIKISSDAGMFNLFFSYGNMCNWTVDPKWRATPVEQVKPRAIPRRNPGCTTQSCWKNEWLNPSEKRLKTAAISYMLGRTLAKTGRQKDWQIDRSSILWLLLADWWPDTITSQLREYHPPAGQS